MHTSDTAAAVQIAAVPNAQHARLETCGANARWCIAREEHTRRRATPSKGGRATGGIAKPERAHRADMR